MNDETEHKPPMSLAEFKRVASIDKEIAIDNIDDKINDVWGSFKQKAKKGARSKTFYASDVNASLFSDNIVRWNIDNLQPQHSLIHRMKKEDQLDGIHKCYMYVGVNESVFSFHVENYNLNAISYLHFGAPKVWYAIPELHAEAFETVCKRFFPANYDACSAPLRHRTLLIDRSKLEEFDFPVTEAIHQENQFIIVWGGAYHAGFNTGFNIAEAVNFASSEWYTVGRKYKDCDCAYVYFKLF